LSKRKRNKTQTGYDTHHILFYRKEWSKGYKQKLRRCFAYEIPIEIHQELHKKVEAVPALEEAQAKELWILYQKEGDMELDEALRWLMLNSPSADFSIAIMAQWGFLRNNLGRS
jgi:hypothetical protein